MKGTLIASPVVALYSLIAFLSATKRLLPDTASPPATSALPSPVMNLALINSPVVESY
jgi:hypothetical protein